MIYGSTGATHFDQLAKILTGYEITGARSSGIFMGILSIAVGFLFKITAVPFRAAVGRTAAYRCMLHESAAFSVVLSHSCPPRRATRSVVLSHKISTPPACWPGESKFSSGQLSTQSSAKNTYDCRALSSFRPLTYWDSSLRALPALYNKKFRLGPGKRWQQQKGRGPCSCCARPLLSQWGSRFGIH
ncbi:hypothetical protein G4B88_001707 [Cannabis sativa]|uniref:NADH:quinone oxidoreductase/Mrp antiporter transmembrane domain-containing protein n=1 Tax=Cannabis sativa TaxID=3483 RepID=A0A7J6I1X0_CANSA|nr:hypothetical protein G4B88_001707 [Cannabis sativa]